MLGVQAGALAAQLLDAQAGRVVEVQVVAMGAQALGLGFDVGNLVEAAG